MPFSGAITFITGTGGRRGKAQVARRRTWCTSWPGSRAFVKKIVYSTSAAVWEVLRSCWQAASAARAVGISISPVQITAARSSARSASLNGRCAFLVADAARLPIAPSSFDVVWSVECTEHLEDKQALFSNLATALRPGGRFAIAAWVKVADDPLVEKVCRAFLCPNLATAREYMEWIPGAQSRDVTAHVLPTWKLCRAIAASSILRRVANPFSEFLDGFQAIDEAFRTGKMAYVLFAGSALAA